jgi:hypothetical protein
MKANIKLPIGFVVVSSIIALTIAFISYSPISILLILGVLYLVTYLVLGIIKRKDALIISNEMIIIKTPFKNKIYEFNNIKSVYLDSDGKQLKGVIITEEYEEDVKFFSDIYDVGIEEIYNHIINKHPNLAVNKEE